MFTIQNLAEGSCPEKSLNTICNRFCVAGSDLLRSRLIPLLPHPCPAPPIPFCHPLAAHVSYPVDLSAGLIMLLCLCFAGLSSAAWCRSYLLFDEQAGQRAANPLSSYSYIQPFSGKHFENVTEPCLFNAYTMCYALLDRRFSSC